MTSVRTYTDNQATDEAVRLLIRKLGRLYPEAHAYLLSKLPDGARDALTMADNRADYLRAIDTRDNITREYPSLVSWWEDTDEEIYTD